MSLRREFRDRDDLLAYLRRQFPWAEGGLSPFHGGRAAAEERLGAFQPARYAATRGYLSGSASRLSPYIRHGVLTLREVFQRVRGRFEPSAPGKFLQELAWRDYWQRIYFEIGEEVWADREPSKTGALYSPALPEDWGQTKLACMDGFVAELESTGYLHNHSRMWVAAYLIHWRRVQWQTGARWFLRHLVDGDPASNNLSWQWVGSTFSVKPYIFNRENLERYTEGRYCRACALRDNCPLEGSYEELSARLFPAPAAVPEKIL